MNRTIEHWRKTYEGLTGGQNDYFLAIHPGLPDCINRFYHYQKMKSFWELLRNCRLSKGYFVLDVGCGPGMFSQLFYRSGARVVGIDVSKKLIERNNAAFPDIRFMNMSATVLGFENETFDIVNSMMVLQHIPYTEQQGAIFEMCRVLRPNGYIMIIESIYAKDKSFHVFPLPADEWIASFEKHGLSLVHWHGMEYVTLRRLYSKALGFAAKLKKGGGHKRRLFI
jgi:2-polyprenyl-3-methyl-5-hydroxy-6-metoxy-1,4-benzoquinol methylase